MRMVCLHAQWHVCSASRSHKHVHILLPRKHSRIPRRLAAEFEEKRKQDRNEQGKAGRLEFVRPASGPDLARLLAGGDLAAQVVATAKAAAGAKASAAAAGAARRASKWDTGRK